MIRVDRFKLYLGSIVNILKVRRGSIRNDFWKYC